MVYYNFVLNVGYISWKALSRIKHILLSIWWGGTYQNIYVYIHPTFVFTIYTTVFFLLLLLLPLLPYVKRSSTNFLHLWHDVLTLLYWCIETVITLELLSLHHLSRVHNIFLLCHVMRERECDSNRKQQWFWCYRGAQVW